MWRRFKLGLIIAAWLLATGGQWDAAQVVAWGRMIYDSSLTMPLTEAVRATFKPGNSCSLCRAADAAKRTADSVPALKFENKIVLFFQPASQPVIAAPPPASWLRDVRDIRPAQRAAPLLQPPKSGAV